MASTLDLVIFGLAPLVVLWIMSYERILNHVDEVKDNWTAHRCNPLYMPFASLIQPEVGNLDNFNHCIAGMGKHVLKAPLDTIQHVLQGFSSLMQSVLDRLQVFRDLRRKLTGVMLSVVTMALGKMTGLVSILTGNMQKILDIIRRMIGSGTVAALFGYTLFAFVKATWNTAITILRAFVIAMLAISVVLAMFNPILLAITIAIAALFASAGGFSTL